MSRTGSIVGLILILIFAVWWRCHTIGPTVRDQLGVGVYPTIEAQVTPQDPLIWADPAEYQPPGVQRLVSLTGGLNELSIKLLPVPFVLATILIVWWIGNRLGGPLPAIVSSLTYAILSSSPALFGHIPQVEHVANLFAVASLALMIYSWTDRDGPWWALELVGLALGLATLLKPVTFVLEIVYCLALRVRNGRSPRGRRKDLGDLLVGFGAVWFFVGLAMGVNGTLETGLRDFSTYCVFSTVEVPVDPDGPHAFVRWLAGNGDADGLLPPPFGKSTDLNWWASGTWPVWLASVVAIYVLLGSRQPTTRKLVALWTLASFVAVALPRLFLPHYYLLATPGVSLAMGLLLEAANEARVNQRRVMGSIGIMIVVLSMFGLMVLQVRDYLMIPPSQLSRSQPRSIH